MRSGETAQARAPVDAASCENLHQSRRLRANSVVSASLTVNPVVRSEHALRGPYVGRVHRTGRAPAPVVSAPCGPQPHPRAAGAPVEMEDDVSDGTRTAAPSPEDALRSARLLVRAEAAVMAIFATRAYELGWTVRAS